MDPVIRSGISLLLGYVIGSLLPASFVARARGFDIRERGNRNPGIANAAETLGYSSAALIAPFDLVKAPAAIHLALLAGNGLLVSYAAGVAAVIGHRAPFYLGFRGGEGLAPSVGILFYAVGALVWADPLFLSILVPILVGMGFLFLTRMKEKPVVPFVFGFLPLAMNAVILFYGVNVHSMMFLIVSLFIVGHRIARLLRPRIREMGPEQRRLLLRKWLRPLATVFAVGALLWREPTLGLLGAVFLAFVALEIVRFVSGNKRFPMPYKREEGHRISSMVMFLFAALLMLYLFPAPIASLALLFVIFGDLLAWCVGTALGGRGFMEKTWSGSTACFVACFTLAALYQGLGLLPLPVGVLGAVSATAIEMSPLQEDNFVMPVASAIVMTLL